MQEIYEAQSDHEAEREFRERRAEERAVTHEARELRQGQRDKVILID